MTGPKGEQGPAGHTGAPGPPGELLGAPIQPNDLNTARPQNDGRKNKRKRNRRNRNRRRRAAEPADIDDDLDNVRDKLMARQENGIEVQVGEVIQEVSTVLQNHIDSLKREIEIIKYPDGRRESPAISCREIKLGHPSFKSDWYYVDPNLGSIDDAIKVYCDFTDSPQTCVYPTQKTKMSNERFYENAKKNKLFKFLKDGFEIRYASNIQMQFLRLLSEGASQNFTYYCQGSVAWEDGTAGGSLDKAIDLIGSNEHEFNTADFTPSMVREDTCKDKQKGFTTFEITTKKLDRLPIINFRPKDYGGPFQKFGFEAGRICFY